MKMERRNEAGNTSVILSRTLSPTTMSNHSVKSLLDIRRTSGVPQKQYGPSAKGDGEEAVGRRDGVAVKKMPSETSRAAGRARRASQNPVAGRSVKLSEHRVRAEQVVHPLTLDTIASVAQSMRLPKDVVTKAARDILDGKDPGFDDTPEDRKKYFLALSLAAHCVAPQTSREERAALLTPVGPFTRQPLDLVRHFQNDYPEDAEGQEALIELVIKLKGAGGRVGDSPKKNEDDLGALLQKRHKVAELMALLALWLDIPALDEGQREERHEKVRDRLAEFINDSRGQSALTSVNTHQVAPPVGDRATFERVYDELGDRAGQGERQSSARALLGLFERYPACTVDELKAVLKALLSASGYDLNAENAARDATARHQMILSIEDGWFGNTQLARFDLATRRVNDFQSRRAAP